MKTHSLHIAWLLAVLPVADSLGADPSGELYIMSADRDLPTIAMYKTETDGRKVTASDLPRVTQAVLRWNDNEAADLVRLERFPNLKTIHIGRCNLRFENLKYLSNLKPTGLYADRYCEARPATLHVLEAFPQLEELGIGFGLQGVRATMKALEIQELEVLRTMPKLRIAKVSGWGVTSIATPRFCGHPNLEVLDVSSSSVNAKGEIQLRKLPKLRHLHLPGVEDRHMDSVVALPTLESFTADAEYLTLGGFVKLSRLPHLTELNLDGFWTPVPPLTFLRNIGDFSAEELQVVMAVQVLRNLAEEETELTEQRQWANQYAAILTGLSAEPIRRDRTGRTITFVQQAFREQHTIDSIQRRIAQEAIRMAQASRTAKPAFYDAVHQAVEKYSGLTFSRPPLDQANASSPVKKLRSITNSLGMQFREIAAGSFVHVDERQGKTTARVTQPFYLGVFEVTQSQFKSVMGFNPSGLGTRSIYDKTVELPLHNDNLPVNNITALEGIKFCWKLSQVDAERKCKRSYRLPTEHEWELACRAGTTTRFHFGGTGDYTPKLANFAPRHFRYGHEFPTTAPQAIGSYPPNAFGIYDMHGNVCEPCMDARGKWEASMPDFVRINDAPGSHVYRGADYLSMPQDTGSSYRHHFYTGVPFAQAGLRVVCVIEPASKLSRKILETQHSWCDPTLQELRFAKRAITKATEAINKGDTSAYLDRVAAYARHAKHSKDPMRDFKLAKADLLASKAHVDARYKRVEYGEVGRDLAVAVAERCEQMGEAKAARAWWQTALRFANLATDETRKMAAEHNDAKQRKYKFQRAADQLRQATEIMEELGLVDEAIARLDEEIKRLPDFMPLRERRAEVMQTDPNAT